MKKFLFSLCLAAAFLACGDDDAFPELTITTTSPQNVNAGDFLIISGSASDDIDLVNVTMVSDALGLTFEILGSQLAANPNFDITVELDAATPAGNYTIVITANDSSNQATTRDLEVIVN